ncbi:MAG: glycosyltransferase family protein [Anaerolineaceae bacterium]|nr:glycosyltransferase family protein [Anaerolineaceae bacterium]
MIGMRTVAIIQARMSSSRLPGKVLLDLAGEPMLVRVLERVCRAKTIDDAVIATTTDPADDPIVNLCRERGYSVYRGSMFDVLDRFYGAARQMSADVIVRVTADCPVIDPDVIDHTVNIFHSSGADFAANRLPPPWKRTWPIGLDTEVCSFSAPERAWKEASLPYEREHVMPYFYDVEGRFKMIVTEHDPDYGAQRWTVDTPEDLQLLSAIFVHFAGQDSFSWLDVLDLMEKEPELARINSAVRHKIGTEVDSRMSTPIYDEKKEQDV